MADSKNKKAPAKNKAASSPQSKSEAKKEAKKVAKDGDLKDSGSTGLLGTRAEKGITADIVADNLLGQRVKVVSGEHEGKEGVCWERDGENFAVRTNVGAPLIVVGYADLEAAPTGRE